MLVSRESPPKAESPPFPLFLHWRHWLTAGNESGYIRPSCAFFMSREHNSFQLLSPCKRSTAWSPCLRQKARLCFGAVFSFLTAHPPLTVAIDCFLLTRTSTLTPVVVAVCRGQRSLSSHAYWLCHLGRLPSSPWVSVSPSGKGTYIFNICT